MNIDIPTEHLEILNLIAEKGHQTAEDDVNACIRFFIMIHFMPYEDQVALKSIISKTYDDIELKGLH